MMFKNNCFLISLVLLALRLQLGRCVTVHCAGQVGDCLVENPTFNALLVQGESVSDSKRYTCIPMMPGDNSLPYAATYSDSEYENGDDLVIDSPLCVLDTCTACVQAGRSWQIGACNPSAACIVSDTGCFDTLELCDVYAETEIASKVCPQAGTCTSCIEQGKYCRWSNVGQNCFNGYNYWGPPDEIVDNSENCKSSTGALEDSEYEYEDTEHKVSTCPVIPSQDNHVSMPGGLTEHRVPTGKVWSMLKKDKYIRAKLLESLLPIFQGTILDLDICSYRTQVVAGTNYHIVLSLGAGKDLVEVTIFEPLSYMESKNSLKEWKKFSYVEEEEEEYEYEYYTSTDVEDIEVDLCPPSKGLHAEKLCMLSCPPPKCKSNAWCALRTGSCCEYECKYLMKPPSTKEPKTKEPKTEPPCMMVDCAIGYRIYGQDSRGCGGTCKRAVCTDCICPGNFGGSDERKREHLPGSQSEFNEPDDVIRDVMDNGSLMYQMLEKGNFDLTQGYKICSYRTQLVRGTNYFVRLSLPSGNIEVRVYQDLDGEVSVSEVHEVTPEKPGPNGCCYEVSFGSQMKASFSGHTDMTKEKCLVEERMGGATRFEVGTNCEELKSTTHKNKKVTKNTVVKALIGLAVLVVAAIGAVFVCRMRRAKYSQFRTQQPIDVPQHSAAPIVQKSQQVVLI